MDTDVSKQANDDRMKELVELLNQAIQAYYMLDTEIMTNHEYDKLFYELEQLEAGSGVHLPGSPVGTVGYTVMSELEKVELEKVRHAYPAKSLDKTKSQKKLADWLDHQAGILSYKLDGLTMVLTYREGELVSAVTRGDGFVGEDVMHNVKYVDGVPCRSDSFGVPRTCPYCGSKLSVIKSDNSDTEIIKCLDPNCPAKSIGKFECMVGKTGLDVKGMSRSTVDQFVKLGLLSSYSDLFDLRDHRDMLIKLVGFGEKSIDKLLSGIETARETTFVKFFCSLGIPNCGKHVAGVLDRYLGMNHTSKSKAFLNLFADDLVMAYDVLVKLDGIGPEIADGMTEWFYEHYDETVAYLSRLTIIDDLVCENKDNSGVLSGKSFVITGKLELYKNRKSLELDIKAHGGMVMSAVSKNTDYLICNQDLGSSKSKKAKELGVSVITEQEYQALVEG